MSGMSSLLTALQNEGLLSLNDDEISSGALHSERTDGQLVDHFLAGDATAFEQIFDRHKRLVAITASRYLRRPDEIEDIVQISFAKAFVELESFRGRHELSLASWLSRIAANACIDTLRNRKRKPAHLSCDLSEGERSALAEIACGKTRSPEKQLIDRDLSEKLLSRLHAEDRALLHMIYVDEMSVAAIADLLGWSKPKVKVRAWRARNALRKVLRRYL